LTELPLHLPNWPASHLARDAEFAQFPAQPAIALDPHHPPDCLADLQWAIGAR